MIHSFKDKETAALAVTGASRQWSGIASSARRRLDQLEKAKVLRELADPPGNHLEALKGDREGQHSIRINDQWRICFRWAEDGAYEVEIVDYH